MFSNFFPNIALGIMSKNTVDPKGPQMTSQYGAYALHTGYATLHGLMSMYTPTRPLHPHARTDKYVILIAFPQL